MIISILKKFVFIVSLDIFKISTEMLIEHKKQLTVSKFQAVLVTVSGLNSVVAKGDQFLTIVTLLSYGLVTLGDRFPPFLFKKN